MYNILVCDDEKDIVAALKIYLESEGYGVIEAFNGREALDRLRENEVHLVLMDIMMPVMDGLSAMAALRRVSNVPVILLTAKGEDTDKVLGSARTITSQSRSTWWRCWRACAHSSGGTCSSAAAWGPRPACWR